MDYPNAEYTTTNCPHGENSRILDSREGTIICLDCSLVLDERTFPIDSSSTASSRGHEPSTLDGAVHRLFSWCQLTQNRVLQDWTANAHIPDYIVSISLTKLKSILRSQGAAEQIARVSVGIDEVTALALYYSLIDEEIPRPLRSIAALTETSLKALDRLSDIFPHANYLTPLKASIWMPSLSYFLDLSYKEEQLICGKADDVQEKYSFSPITILTAIIFRFYKWREEQTAFNSSPVIQSAYTLSTLSCNSSKMSRAQLCHIAHISPSTLTRALKILENEPTLASFHSNV